MAKPTPHVHTAPSVSSAGADDAAREHNPHYRRLGGHAGVVRLVEAFYAEMDRRPDARTIRALHGEDLTPVRQVLVRFLTEWLGGPALYSQERGHPRLRRRHLPFRIGAAERDAWMACMRAALQTTCGDTELRAELEAAFARTADFIRNDAASSHQPHSTPPQPEASASGPCSCAASNSPATGASA